MALKSETVFSNRVRPFLKGLPRTWHSKIQQVAISGTPDFLVCIAGRFVALELKKDGRAKISQLQIHTLGEIRKAGGIGLVVYPENWDLTQKVLTQLSTGETLNETQLQILA